MKMYLILALVLSGLGAATTRGAQAAMPGGNGRIAFLRMEQSGDNETTIMTIEPDGTDERLLIGPEHRPGGIAYSPDGDRIAFACNSVGSKADLCMANADGSDITTVVEDSPILGVDWSPDGSRLVGVCPARKGFGVCTMRADGAGLRRIANNGSSTAWSSRNRIAFTRSILRAGDAARDGLVVARPDGSSARLVVKATTRRKVYELDWAPGGRRLVYTGRVGDGPVSIFIVHRDGSHHRRVAARAGDPTFSPDGRWIVFEGGGRLYRVRPNGQDRSRIVEAGEALAYGTDWQPQPQ